ncbi:DUF4298 domain-containing protein [Streptococcus suis]|nr:DUF4298 domain-containing protein [Streptococcus suis]MCG9883098.1 DUF4298 domain-containing protein [Streptococcus suis]MCG9908731.1 DUF4298 domain-containing protein [Streptococcus suis]MCG9933135.1 DUF4298 domain-containing protein [Streptococcus suis]
MNNIMEARKRVEEMEKIFNRQLELNQSLSDSLSQLSQEQSTYLQLLDYYQSQTYMEDLDLSNKGHFNGIP